MSETTLKKGRLDELLEEHVNRHSKHSFGPAIGSEGSSESEAPTYSSKVGTSLARITKLQCRTQTPRNALRMAKVHMDNVRKIPPAAKMVTEIVKLRAFFALRPKPCAKTTSGARVDENTYAWMRAQTHVCFTPMKVYASAPD